MLINEPMSKHTSLRVGGPADRYYLPRDITDLQDFLRLLPDNEPLTWLGLGTNVLVRDGGIRGTVIVLAGMLKNIALSDDALIYAEAGASLARLSRFAGRNNLSGLEFAAGIPGTVGGALAMNAGAFGSEIWGWAASVKTINRRGEIHERYPEDFDIEYRNISAANPDEWFLSASFLLDRQEETTNIKGLLDKRNSSQPVGVPSCGSVFKNPQGYYAGKLIEGAGLKGYRLGGAVISEKHANFIINTGQASAADVEGLIEIARVKIKDKFAVELETEVRIIGEKS